MTSVWVIRWILVALTAALAVALVVRGNVIIGVLVGTLSFTRAVLFVRLRHECERFRQRLARRRGR